MEITDYSKQFELLPFLNWKIEFVSNFLRIEGCNGWSSKKIIEFCSNKTYPNMFLPARKLKKKEEIEENYITTFDTLNLGAFANLKKKKLFWRLPFKISIQNWVFFPFARHVYDYMNTTKTKVKKNHPKNEDPNLYFLCFFFKKKGGMNFLQFSQ